MTCGSSLITGSPVMGSWWIFFLDRNPLLDPGVFRYLKILRETALRLYEVVDLLPGESVILREVLGGTKVTVSERLGSRSLTRHALVAARVIARGPSGQPEIESGILHIPELVREQTISQLPSYRKNYRREHPQGGETDFFKDMGPFFHEGGEAERPANDTRLDTVKYQ